MQFIINNYKNITLEVILLILSKVIFSTLCGHKLGIIGYLLKCILSYVGTRDWPCRERRVPHSATYHKGRHLSLLHTPYSALPA